MWDFFQNFMAKLMYFIIFHFGVVLFRGMANLPWDFDLFAVGFRICRGIYQYESHGIPRQMWVGCEFCRGRGHATSHIPRRGKGIFPGILWENGKIRSTLLRKNAQIDQNFLMLKIGILTWSKIAQNREKCTFLRIFVMFLG